MERVRLVQHALSIGFTLDELARVLRVKDQGGAPCREVRSLAATKLKALEAQIRSLGLLRSQLRRLIGEWDAQLARTPKGERAHLLDQLAVTGPRHTTPGDRRSTSWNRLRRRPKQR